MKISAINQTTSFGKTPLLSCTIKQSEDQKKVEATLYKMDPKNDNDQKDIQYSKQTLCLKKDFEAAKAVNSTSREFYLLQNNKTGEVISCAETTHHFRPFEAKNPGLSTVIDEMHENTKYINGAEPMLAYIAKRAGERYDSTVYTAFRLDEIPSLKRAKFSETKLGEFMLPEKRYHVLIDQAERHSQIEYLV